LRVEEKSILLKFVGLYYISTFILLSIIALLIYNMQYQSIYNLTVSNLETLSSKISSKIITSDMKNEKLDFKTLCSSDLRIKFALFDKTKKVVYTDAQQPITLNFTKKNYLSDDKIVIIDKSTLGHLDIYSIVMMNDSFKQKIQNIIITIIIGFAIFYIILCTIGFYLIKLFMKPIENERMRLDNFIKDTTHELNTPITALMICTEKNTPRSEKNMERIYLSATRISEIYKDLTHIFLESKTNKKIQPIHIDKIIIKEIEYFELLASKKDISIILDIQETTINIDKEDFKRILSNICSNAIKYTNRKGKISLILKNKKLSIEDTGIGIDLSKKENIFNRYYRATTQDGGFGMGLNIVYKICEEYNIKIEVNSKPKVGTTFSFDFKYLINSV